MASSLGLVPLTMPKALELYDLLGEYIPDYVEGEPIIDFIGKIVNNIATDNSPAYTDAICLMTGYHFLVLSRMSTEKIFELFAIGLSVNNIIQLKQFCKDIGYG